MKVYELIQLLKGEDPELEVHIAHNYGDHWHTTVAPKAGRVEEAPVVYSEYHRMPKVVEEDDDPGEADGSEKNAVVIFATGC